ncbi:MAG: hypothetical protein KDG50_12590 [Chromatiales bacterium]|nr:hypothetical protein [Chromatiales bacterium]
MRVVSFRSLRIVVLLVILAAAAIYTQGQRLSTRGWYEPLEMQLFPIAGDTSPATGTYIESLDESRFAAIERFFKSEGAGYRLVANRPVSVRIGPTIDAEPPDPPGPDGGVLSAVWYSLKLRVWAWRVTPAGWGQGDVVRMYLVYRQGEPNAALPHSLGIEKGLLGVVHLYADSTQDAQNTVIVAHELLHTVGATDKYDARGEPRWPDGYADPTASPRWPQKRCEIMAVRIPDSPERSLMPENLRACTVGRYTAAEIGWIGDATP